FVRLKSIRPASSLRYRPRPPQWVRFVSHAMGEGQAPLGLEASLAHEADATATRQRCQMAFGTRAAAAIAMVLNRTECLAMFGNIARLRPEIVVLWQVNPVHLLGKETAQFTGHFVM